VISNRPDAAGLDAAAAMSLPVATVDHKAFPDKASFERSLDETVKSAGAELICLAGFMRLLSEDFVGVWRDRLINIHPSLLPAFKGLDTHERALAAGVRITGCTVHFVRPAMDDGPILMQAAVPIAASDTAETLAARVLDAEHKIYPAAVRLIAEGRVTIIDEIVHVSGAGDRRETSPAMFSPPL